MRELWDRVVGTDGQSPAVEWTGEVTHLLRGLEIRPWLMREMERLQLALSWEGGDGGSRSTRLEPTARRAAHAAKIACGVWLGESGADAFTIMRLMGHSSVTVSQKYVHPSPETLERAVQRLQNMNQGRKELETAQGVGIPANFTTPKSAKTRNPS